MKSWLAILLPCISLAVACMVTTAKNDAPDTTTSTTQAPVKPDFEKEVMPVLVKNCSPCHFPGGKMYERLPFDKDTTLVNHSGAILKRIKNQEENSLLEKFIEQYK